MSSVAVDLNLVNVDPLARAERLPQRPIVFFDGVCGFCNYWVNFVLSRDPDGKLAFAPLQGVTAEQLLPTEDREQLHSLVLWSPQKSYRQTSAVVRILWTLGGVWWLLGWLLWLIPRPFRNLGYVLVASNRYRIFGKKDACRMPTAAEHSRFLP